MKKVIIIIAVVVIIPILVLGYLGFIPGLSDLMTPPRDLGIRYTEQDITTAYQKFNVEHIQITEAASVAESLVTSGSHPVKEPFTQEEITARWNTEEWRYNAIDNAQVKITGNTMEISGRLIKANVQATADRFGVDVSEYQDKIDMVPGNPRVYLKGTGSVTDGKFSLDIEEIEVGRVKIPLDQVPEQELEELAEHVVTQFSGFEVKNAKISGGALDFDGSMPDKIEYLK